MILLELLTCSLSDQLNFACHLSLFQNPTLRDLCLGYHHACPMRRKVKSGCLYHYNRGFRSPTKYLEHFQSSVRPRKPAANRCKLTTRYQSYIFWVSKKSYIYIYIYIYMTPTMLTNITPSIPKKNCSFYF
jgi:hypothetical protein